MLSPDAKALLAFTKKNNCAVLFKDIQSEFSWEFDKINSTCSQLVDQGFADWKLYHPPFGDKPFHDGICLSEKARYSTRFFWGSVGEFLLKSVAIPIFVAFVTAVITAIITVKVAG